jgi:hypothetical protein
MSTTPRLPAAIDGEQPTFTTVFKGWQPELMALFAEVNGTLWSHGEIDHPTREVTRIRNARVTACGA